MSCRESQHRCRWRLSSLWDRTRARACAGVHLARREQRDVARADLTVRRVELHAQRAGAALALHHALVDLTDLGLAGAAVVQREVADRRHVAEVAVDADDRRYVSRDHVVDEYPPRTAIARAVAARTHELAGLAHVE